MTETDVLPVRDDLDTSTHSRKKVRKWKWVSFGLAAFIFFSIVKFPEAKLKALIQAQLTTQLSQLGIQMSAGSSELSFLFGLEYELEEVRFFFPRSNQPLEIKTLRFSPSLIALIVGDIGGSASIEIGGGEIDLSFKGDQAGKNFQFSFDLSDVDFEKAQVLRSLTPINGGLVLNGEGDFSGSPSSLTSLSGSFDLEIANLKIPPQKLVIPGLFFSPEIPSTIRIKDGKLRGSLKNGTLLLSEARLGSPRGQGGDLYLDSSGQVRLSPRLMSSSVDLKVKFALYGELQKSFGLLDTLLKNFKKSDGTFSYQLKGPVQRPRATPL